VSLVNRNIESCKIENYLLIGARKYFIDNNYIEINVPHLTNATGSCENMDTLFSINCFGNQVFLAQTGQLYLETLVDTYNKVYCLSPSFRAEPRVDNRHLIEFPLLEIEINKNFDKLLLEIENIFHSMFSYIQKKTGRFNHLQLPPYKKIKYKDAIDELNLEWGEDISSVNENKLLNKYDQPFFLTHFPIEMKFFNMKQNSKNKRIVNSADLILPYGGESVGAAEREHEYQQLKYRLITSIMFKQLKDKGKGIEDFKWYLDYYKDPRILHSGCGIGLTRVVQYVMENTDIRNCITYPVNKEIIW